MDESGRGDDGSAPAPQAAARDGLINFASYSDAQLKDLSDTLDQVRFPGNYRNLLAEIERRAAAAPLIAPDGLTAGRFTRSDGLAGWRQALASRSPLYGAGSMEAQSGEVILNGWRRSWLGAPIHAQLAVAVARVRNVTLDNDLVAFEISTRFWLTKKVEFRAESAAAAAALVARLPNSRTPGFERQAAEIRDFNTRLRSVERPLVVVPALVAINFLAYTAMCVATGRWGSFDIQSLVIWGGNLGALTVNGQWWRLISALFLHANPPHVLLNMWALWNVGRLCERLFGRYAMAFIYLASGLIASLSSVIWNPNLVSVGASGAIFGVLGAFLAFYLKPGNRVPRAVARRHWISTSAFVLFNLVDGMLATGIDNAAHVGGLLGGFVLGWILARPLKLHQRRAMSALQVSTSAAFLAVFAVMAVWQVKGIGSELTASEQFVRAHSSYMIGESKNLHLWAELASKAATGAISDEDLGEQFERDIVPFWKSEHAQIDKENLTLKGPGRPFALLVADFVRIRLEWAQKIVDAMKTRDSKTLAEAQAYIPQDAAARARLERVNVRSQMEHRPRALVNNPIVVKIRNALSGYHWQCVHAPAAWSPIPAKTDSPMDGPAQRTQVGCLAQQLFMTAAYGELDSLMARYATSLGDLPDGSSRYEGLIGGLHNLFDYSGIDTADLLGRTADWRRAVKNSHRADLMEVDIFSAAAWAARGHGTAGSVSPQSWALFSYRTEMAAAALDDTKVGMQGDPAWWAEAENVALDRGRDVDQIRAVFDAGFARFPKYRPLERAMLRVLMPRWGGSYDHVDQFIRDMEGKAPYNARDQRYAELYVEYASLEDDDLNLFADTNAYWIHMKLGLSMRVQDHPSSDVVLNQFAVFACRAEDGDVYVKLRSSLDRRFSSVAWSATNSLASCDKKFSGKFASVAQLAADREKALHPVAMVSLGGMRLGMTSEELTAAKGPPASKQDASWTYNLPGGGVFKVTFTNQSNGKVAAIEYAGDQASAPSELPYLNGESEQELRDQFGNLIGMGSPADDVTSLRYRNGVYADTRNGSVFRYGIYAVQLPH